jgi:hypothetical protein
MLVVRPKQERENFVPVLLEFLVAVGKTRHLVTDPKNSVCRRSNHSGRVVDWRETALHDVGLQRHWDCSHGCDLFPTATLKVGTVVAAAANRRKRKPRGLIGARVRHRCDIFSDIVDAITYVRDLKHGMLWSSTLRRQGAGRTCS